MKVDIYVTKYDLEKIAVGQKALTRFSGRHSSLPPPKKLSGFPFPPDILYNGLLFPVPPRSGPAIP